MFGPAAGPGFLKKWVHMYNGVGVRFDDFIYFFLNIPWKWNTLVSLRPNSFIFMGYLKTGGGRDRSNPLGIRHCGPNDSGLFFNVNDEAISLTILKLYDINAPIYGKNFWNNIVLAEILTNSKGEIVGVGGGGGEGVVTVL